jgi:hypothetical protein
MPRKGPDFASTDAEKLLRLLRRVDLSAFNVGQLDQLERILSADIALVKEEVLGRLFEVHDWDERGGDIYEDCGLKVHENAEWVDHPSRLVHKEKGGTIYRAEPYSLKERDLRQLVTLADSSWHVGVEWLFNAHFPGRTMAVIVWKGRESK